MITHILFIFLIFSEILFAVEIKITSNLENDLIENQKLSGTITITHDDNAKIDSSSFKMDKKPLPVKFIRSVQISNNPPTSISIYSFEIEGKPKGLYLLPSISATVGGKNYRAIASSYEIEGQKIIQEEPKTTSNEKPTEAILKLESYIQGKTPIYPGQRVYFIYRFLFNKDVEMIEEYLPLLEAKGFRKIGEQQIKDSIINGLNVELIYQEAEAVNPGEYSYGPSHVIGKPYEVGTFGKKYYNKEPIRADSPEIKISVLPFPLNQKPSSFNGAIGEFNFDVKLKSLSSISVGDMIVLDISVQGEGELEKVRLPEIMCQPGFPGLFRLSDLPPPGNIENKIKTFIVKMQALSFSSKEIPSIEFSYFSPKKNSYVVLHSQPIPIEIKQKNEEKNLQPQNDSNWKYSQGVQPIKLAEPLTLKYTDVKNLPFSQWWTLIIIPISFILIQYQRKISPIIKYKWKNAKNSSDYYWKKINSLSLDDINLLPLLRKTFMLKLVEKRIIPSIETPVDDIPDSKIKDFLKILDATQYGLAKYERAQIMSTAQSLMREYS